MKKIHLWLLILLLILLQYRLWLGSDGSIPQWLQAQHALKNLKIENIDLIARNAQLAEEVEDLKSGLDALEERARSQMGMIKPDETYFQLIEPEPEKPSFRPRQPQGTQ